MRAFFSLKQRKNIFASRQLNVCCLCKTYLNSNCLLFHRFFRHLTDVCINTKSVNRSKGSGAPKNNTGSCANFIIVAHYFTRVSLSLHTKYTLWPCFHMIWTIIKNNEQQQQQQNLHYNRQRKNTHRRYLHTQCILCAFVSVFSNGRNTGLAQITKSTPIIPLDYSNMARHIGS